VKVAPPVVIVALFAVGQVGSVLLLPAVVHLKTHLALSAGAVGTTMSPML
jgi:Ca2+/Na+ antiporter